MLRKIGFTLLCAAASISTSAYSIPIHSLTPGVTLEYELPSNLPQIFVNYMFWTIEANCKIETTDESNELFVEALNKKGKVNDIILSEGQSMRVTVQNGQNLKITADSGAKVKITNMGLSLVKAICSA